MAGARTGLPPWLGQPAVLAGVCATVALVLGSIGIADASLWLDETFTVFDARRSLADIFAMRGEAFGGAHHPPGYFLLMKATLAVCGAAEPCVRAPSVLGNAALAAVLVLLGSRWFGRLGGALAGLSWACMPYAIKYAQQARHYGLLALVAGLLLWQCARMLEHTGAPPRRRAVGLGLLASASLWLHLFALPLLAALALWCGGWLWAARRRGEARPLAPWLLAAAVAVLASLPLLPGLLQVWLTQGGGQLASRAGPVENARELLVDLASFGLDTPWLAIVAACAAVPGPWSARARVGSLVLLAIAPLSVVLVRNPEHFVTLRYFMPSLVPVTLLWGAGLATVLTLPQRVLARRGPSPRWLGAALGLLLVAYPLFAIGERALAGLRKQYATAGYEPWRGIAEAIREHAGPGDVTVAIPYALVRFPFTVYTLPTDVLDADAEDFVAQLDARAPAQVFVVSSHIDRPERVAQRREALRALARAGYVRGESPGGPRQPAIELLGFVRRRR
ncbi:MAG: glycosyltransferase family 39 protein [Nannocystaceae bacterium]|nr:glycosyltransferase family 39 protein [Nannocystaceae bacterium]